MRNLKVAVLALAAPIGACVTRGSEDSAPAPPAGYNFAYLAPHGDAIGLIQAFDDGTHTYLELDGRSSHLTIRAEARSAPLPYEVGERYITVDGVYDHLVLTDDQNSATLLNEGARPASISTPPAPDAGVAFKPVGAVADAARTPASIAAVGVPESAQTMNATLRVAEINREIGDLDARIRLLTEQLSAIRQADAPRLELRSEFKVPRIVVRFADNSDEAHIDEPLLSLLGAAARAANRICLHGHTDAFVASSAGTDLAIRRAISVRRLLVAQDVSPARIRLFYRGAGNFLANNSTPAGKAQNRRVEIELRKW